MRPRAMIPPSLPVDPAATTVSSSAMFFFLSPAVRPAAARALRTIEKGRSHVFKIR